MASSNSSRILAVLHQNNKIIKSKMKAFIKIVMEGREN